VKHLDKVQTKSLAYFKWLRAQVQPTTLTLPHLRRLSYPNQTFVKLSSSSSSPTSERTLSFEVINNSSSDSDSVKALTETQAGPTELDLQASSTANSNLTEMMNTAPVRILKPNVPTMGNLIKACRDKWNAWTGGKPKPSWVGLKDSATTFKSPNQLRSTYPSSEEWEAGGG
jgi:hypothetical protein